MLYEGFLVILILIIFCAVLIASYNLLQSMQKIRQELIKIKDELDKK